MFTGELKESSFTWFWETYGELPFDYHVAVRYGIEPFYWGAALRAIRQAGQERECERRRR